jgi:hypothetical protein
MTAFAVSGNRLPMTSVLLSIRVVVIKTVGMVRFGSVRFLKGFWRTLNRTIGSVH